MTLRRLPFATGPAEALLREGAELLDSASRGDLPTLRWYQSTQPALVLGRGQPAALVDVPGLPIVARFSGGGAVLMNDALLSLDVVLPVGDPWLEGPMTAVFEHVGQAWATALRRLGVPDVAVYTGPPTASRRGTARQQLLAAICYATLGTGEVTVNGRKLVGLAQRRRRSGAMVQCGLLRRWEPGPLLAAFAGEAEDAEILTAAVGLDELVAAAPADDAVMDAVTAALQEAMERR